MVCLACGSNTALSMRAGDAGPNLPSSGDVVGDGGAGVGGQGGGGAGGSGATTDPNMCGGVPRPLGDCEYGKPTITCVAGGWSFTCPSPPQDAIFFPPDSAVGGGGGAGAGGGAAFDASAPTGGSPGTGGTQGTGGASSGGTGGGTCAHLSLCAGDVVGTWSVTASCLDVSGQLDMTPLGVGCLSAPVTGTRQVSGTWTVNANGTYLDNTVTRGSDQITLPASCLQISGTITTCDRIGSVLGVFGYDTASCAAIANGECACTASVRQTGGLGLVSLDVSTSGSYTVAGSVLTTDVGLQYGYCASGAKLNLIPQSTSPTVTGTIVLQKS
jgi:hypothetical protein